MPIAKIQVQSVGAAICCAGLIISGFSSRCLATPAPTTLTPKQLIMLATAAKQRYWALVYSMDVKAYPYAVGRKGVAPSPSSIIKEQWRWTPWRSYCFEDKTTYAPGAQLTHSQDWYAIGPTATRSMRKGQGSLKSRVGSATVCQVINGSGLRIYGVLPNLIWPADIAAGATDANSKVTWDAKLREYRMSEVLHVRAKTTRYITWIDPRRGFVVTCRRYLYGGKLFREDIFSGWREWKPSMWLPSLCTTIIPGVTVGRSVVSHISKINMPISRADFRLHFPLGATLYNLKRGRIYAVSSGGSR